MLAAKGANLMNKKSFAVTVTLWANRAVALLLAVLLFTLPMLLDWYCQYRSLTQVERLALIIAFYICSVAVALALFNMDGLLRAISRGEIFVQQNVRRIRIVQWCCAGVCLVCIPAALCYYPLLFMVIVMGFLSLTVGVVCRVMEAAVDIREENDLTI